MLMYSYTLRNQDATDYTASSVQNSDKMLIAGLEKNKPRTISKQKQTKEWHTKQSNFMCKFQKGNFWDVRYVGGGKNVS